MLDAVQPSRQVAFFAITRRAVQGRVPSPSSENEVGEGRRLVHDKVDRIVRESGPESLSCSAALLGPAA